MRSTPYFRIFSIKVVRFSVSDSRTWRITACHKKTFACNGKVECFVGRLKRALGELLDYGVQARALSAEEKSMSRALYPGVDALAMFDPRTAIRCSRNFSAVA